MMKTPPPTVCHLKIKWRDGEIMHLPYAEEKNARETQRYMSLSENVLSASILTHEEFEDEQEFRELAAST
jgi:hypothetical protein